MASHACIQECSITYRSDSRKIHRHSEITNLLRTKIPKLRASFSHIRMNKCLNIGSKRERNVFVLLVAQPPPVFRIRNKIFFGPVFAPQPPPKKTDSEEEGKKKKLPFLDIKETLSPF